MAHLVGSSTFTTVKIQSNIGPLVDDGALYSAIGLIELKVLADQLNISKPLELNCIPKSLQGYSH